MLKSWFPRIRVSRLLPFGALASRIWLSTLGAFLLATPTSSFGHATRSGAKAALPITHSMRRIAAQTFIILLYTAFRPIQTALQDHSNRFQTVFQFTMRRQEWPVRRLLANRASTYESRP